MVDDPIVTTYQRRNVAAIRMMFPSRTSMAPQNRGADPNLDLEDQIFSAVPPDLPFRSHVEPARLASSTSRSPMVRHFAVPSYLSASLFFNRFFTTPGAELNEDQSPGPFVSTHVPTNHQTGSTVEPILLPVSWDLDDRGALIDVGTDGLGVSYKGNGKNGDRDAGAVRANRPIPPQCGIYYFEVTVISRGASGYISIGVSHSTVSLSRLPGWEDNSWAYHGDDGRAFGCQATGTKFGPTFSTGDVVGCGVDWTGLGGDQKKPQGSNGARIFFTKNGKIIGFPFYDVKGPLYPTVGMRTQGEALRVNFGNSPFRFEIDAYVKKCQLEIYKIVDNLSFDTIKEKAKTTEELESACIDALEVNNREETVKSMMAEYFDHYGYVDTASAFRDQIKAGKESIEDDSFGLDEVTEGKRLKQIRHFCESYETAKAIDIIDEHFPELWELPAETGKLSWRPRLELQHFIDLTLTDLQPSSLLEIGQHIYRQYWSDTDQTIQQEFAKAFGMVACANPAAARRNIDGNIRRTDVDELIGAIFESHDKPATTSLENLIRHTVTLFDVLGNKGEGKASLLDVMKRFNIS